jgi:hypothetical protein
MNQKSQLLTIVLEQELKDTFGVHELSIRINSKLYTYPITSEFIVRKFKALLRRNKPGKALRLLSLFTTEFNSFKESR